MERVGWGRGVVSAVELIDKKLEKKIHRGLNGWEQKTFSLFRFLRRNQYKKIRRWHFVLVLFFRVASTVLFYLLFA